MCCVERRSQFSMLLSASSTSRWHGARSLRLVTARRGYTQHVWILVFYYIYAARHNCGAEACVRQKVAVFVEDPCAARVCKPCMQWIGSMTAPGQRTLWCAKAQQQGNMQSSERALTGLSLPCPRRAQIVTECIVRNMQAHPGLLLPLHDVELGAVYACGHSAQHVNAHEIKLYSAHGSCRFRLCVEVKKQRRQCA